MRTPHAGLMALLLAAALSGCQEADRMHADRPSPHTAPTTANGCDDLPAIDGDPGILLGTDWSGEDHGYGDTVVVLACAEPSRTGTLAIQTDGDGIEVSPQRVRLADAPGGVAPFEVTVRWGAVGALRVRLDRSGTGGDLAGPVVVADDDGWHFERRAR